MNPGQHSTVVIIDYGSQYTQLIARRIREAGIYSHVFAADVELERIQEFNPKAVILSGGPSSVYDEGAPALPKGFEEYRKASRLPVLGICYGMQLIVQANGGQVASAEKREYGRMKIVPQKDAVLFSVEKTAHKASPLPTPPSEPFYAWMSHGDEMKKLPNGFRLVAQSTAGAAAAIENPEERLFGLQFHPEVTHTEHGREFLRHFLLNVADIDADWNMGSLMDEQIALIREQIGPTAHAICALSGGVDSTVAATLVHKAIGDRLHCVFVDHGMLRYKEQERVMTMFREELHLPVTCVDASERFLSKLKGVSDPEKKRKIIGGEFIAIFDEFAHGLEEQVGHVPEFLVQGTLYPDVIESSPPPGSKGAGKKGGFKHSTTIKSHHNVGGLPEDLRFQLIEPLRDLFKDEVRALGRVLEVPSNFLERHPFPGPGLAVRVIGAIEKPDLDTLRLADEIFISALKEHGIYHEIWQAFAVFLPVKTVGVQGDGRTHANVVALRAVTSSDGMTADWYPFKHEFLAEVSNRICNEVRGVNRVVYDVSSKPPATIEWE